MTATATDVTTSIAPRRVTRTAGIGLAVAALVAVALLSLAIGAKAIPLSTVIDNLLHPSDTQESVIVTDLRVPGTILGLLGVNAGAAAAVIVAIALLGLTGITAYVWFAFLGAAIASVVVYAIGTGGRGAATPARLALAGTDDGGAHRPRRRSRRRTRPTSRAGSWTSCPGASASASPWAGRSSGTLERF